MLQIQDFQILKFMLKKQPVKIEQIKKKFSRYKDSNARIKNLIAERYIIQIRETYEEDNGVTSERTLDIYELTDLGTIEFNNYVHSNKKERLKLWLEHAWIPIIVSLITNLILFGIRQLLPLIQQWFLRSP